MLKIILFSGETDEYFIGQPFSKLIVSFANAVAIEFVSDELSATLTFSLEALDFRLHLKSN